MNWEIRERQGRVSKGVSGSVVSSKLRVDRYSSRCFFSTGSVGDWGW